jgi:hypothetical protein
MEYHCRIQCKNFKIICNKCGEEYKPRELEEKKESHDCVNLLKANLKSAREEIA